MRINKFYDKLVYLLARVFAQLGEKGSVIGDQSTKLGRFPGEIVDGPLPRARGIVRMKGVQWGGVDVHWDGHK
jgi:hypothetical protein